MTESVIKELHFIDDSDDEIYLAKLLLGTQKVSIAVIHHSSLAAFMEATGGGGEGAHPLFILVDLNMPRMRGDIAISKILDIPFFENSIIGMCSGSEDPADRQAAEKAGAQFFVQKPLEMGSLKMICETVPSLSLCQNEAGCFEIWRAD